MSFIDFDDEYLAEMWEKIDWDAAEAKLANWQAALSKAGYRHDTKAITDIQKRIVRDIDCNSTTGKQGLRILLS